MRNILGWVTADGGPRETRIRYVTTEQHHAGIERQQLLGRCNQRIDIDFAKARLVDNKLAESHKECFERFEIDTLASPDSFEGRKDFGSFHETFPQRGVQRRKRQG